MQDNAAPATTTTLSPVNTVAPRGWRFLKYVVLTLFVVLTDAFGVITTALLVLKWVVGESWWPIGLFDSLFPIALMPAFIMLPGSLLIRRWRLALFTLPALVVFIFSYGGLFIPRSVNVDPDAPQMTILTYNIHAETKNLQPLVDVILDANPDMVALQEFTQDAADYFAEALADRYPYQALYPVGRSVVGKGFFSQYPVLSESVGPDENTPRFQRLEIDFDGSRLVVYNVHPTIPHWSIPYDDTARGQNLAALLESAETETLPLLMVGDFNMTDQSDDYRKITDLYKDTYREVGSGLGPTFPDFAFSDFTRFIPPLRVLPQMLRLDYVFHNPGWQAVEAHVWHTSGGSDHHPILARLAVVSS